MLKLKLIILICFCNVVGSSQSLPPSDIQNFDWGKWEVNVPDSVMFESTSLIIESEIFDNYKDCPEGRDIQNYHTIDFNGDGLSDLIYEGRIVGVEGSIVSFFLNNGDSLENVIYLLGNIMSSAGFVIHL